MRSLITIAFLAAVSSTFAQSSTSSAQPSVQTIQVGNGGYQYSPNSSNLAVGSTIVFEFMSTNHSVVKAAFGVPCQPYDDINRGQPSFYSGVFNGQDVFSSNPPTWNLTINDTEPVFYYCTAPGSCVDHHMIGVINPNSTFNLTAQAANINGDTIMLTPGETLAGEGGSATSSSTSSSTSGASKHHSESSISGGAIAGIIVGVVVIIGLVGAMFWYRSRRRRRNLQQQRPPSYEAPSSYGDAPPTFPQDKKTMEMQHIHAEDTHGSPELDGHVIPAVHELVDEDSERMGRSPYRMSVVSELGADTPLVSASPTFHTIHEIG